MEDVNMEIRMDGRSGKVMVEMDPATPMPIAEVARLTGYAKGTLKVMDGKGIPASQRDGYGHRVWSASDVVKIREIRAQNLIRQRSGAKLKGNDERPPLPDASPEPQGPGTEVSWWMGLPTS